MNNQRIITVKELTRAIKEVLEGGPLFRSLKVRGEISNFKRHSSGHLYFTLKDEAASLRAVMFSRQAFSLRFLPRDGMKVIALGDIGLFERDGLYQLYVDRLQEDGTGDQHLALLELKRRLEAEGLFAQSRKRPLPLLPGKVGIITSPTGAAIKDMVVIAGRRYPNLPLLVAPARVQGEDAARSMIAALNRLQRVGVDVIILGRGGGSAEDLSAFNDEELARAIYASRVPVVSAVGHESDWTVADLVADARAATPSEAVALAIQEKSALLAEIDARRQRLVRALRHRVKEGRLRLHRLQTRKILRLPVTLVRERRQQLDQVWEGMVVRWNWRRESWRGQLGSLVGRLKALSPVAILARGYTITRLPDGTVVRRSDQVSDGDQVEILLAQGRLQAAVLSAESGETVEGRRRAGIASE
ncbi:MAG: exodeoxyribonuclease VII large subunit [Firmicutes bacterium]|nr:exodeoxyribonuclease VII large subunit [Bacillota bacterium]